VAAPLDEELTSAERQPLDPHGEEAPLGAVSNHEADH
jgi:hypothetical protein